MRSLSRRLLPALALTLLTLAAMIAGGLFAPSAAQAQEQQPGAESQQPTLEAAAGWTVTLTLTGHTSTNWWFRINWWGTCTPVTGSTSISGIGGYTGGPHDVRAYDNDQCSGDVLASATFTVQLPTLTATVDDDRSVDLALANGPSDWWFRITPSGTCTPATGTTFDNIRGYKAGTYSVAAFEDSACATYITDTAFTIPVATLATMVDTSDRSVDLALTGGPNSWWFRINSWGTCTPVTGTSFDNIGGYKGGPHSVAAYSDSGCNYHVASSSFTIPDTTLSATVDPADWSVDLALSNGPDNWWFRINWWGTCTAANGTSVTDIRGYAAGEHVVAVFPDANCGSHGAIAGDTFIIPTATLTTAVNSDQSFDLMLANGPTNWWFRINSWGTCTPASGTTVGNIGGYAAGQYEVWAYSDSGCTYRVAPLTFDLITLTASGIDATGATLTLAGHSGDWYYKRTGGPADAACTEVSGGATATLSTLTADTAYAYTAYRDSGCASGELASVSFATHLTASNLSETVYTYACSFSKPQNCAVGFNTGGKGGGYTLNSVTVKFKDMVDPNGALGDVVVTLHGSTSYNHQDYKRPADATLATLSGSNPDTAGNYAYACAGAGCALSGGTTYFVKFASTAGDASDESYVLATTLSHNETLAPTGNGWWLLDETDYYTGGNWVSSYPDGGMLKVSATTNPTLAESGVTATTATLTLSHYPGAWWYKRTSGSGGTCTDGPTSYTATLSSLTAGTAYTYKAYDKSGCTDADEIASVTFSTIALTASGIDVTGATLTLAGHSGDWYYKRTGGPADSACTTVNSGATATLSNLTADTAYAYTAYKNSGCASGELASVSFATHLTASNLSETVYTYACSFSKPQNCAVGFNTGGKGGGYVLRSVTVKFKDMVDPNGALGDVVVTLHGSTSYNHQDYKRPADATLATLSGSNPDTAGDYTYACAGAGCALSAGTTYFVKFASTAGDASDESYVLATTLSHNETLAPTGNGWWLLDETDYYTGGNWVSSYPDGGMLKVSATTNPTLAESSVTATTATLTLSHYPEAWWYKRTSGSGGTCADGPTSYTASLGSLTADTAYTYKAYGKSGCADADEIASVTFSTSSS